MITEHLTRDGGHAAIVDMMCLHDDELEACGVDEWAQDADDALMAELDQISDELIEYAMEWEQGYQNAMAKLAPWYRRRGEQS
jgi:hypothetical protein